MKEAIGGIGKVWVPLLNATKRSLTQPFVTYHERNLVGGQYNNLVAGMFGRFGRHGH